MKIEQLENCGCFSPFLGVTESDFRKSAQKGPKSDPVVFKICKSPLYSQMRLSTKSEENRRQECMNFLIPHPCRGPGGGGVYQIFWGSISSCEEGKVI